MEKRATIITYGCQMNVNESAKMKQMLQTMGYSMTEDIENTDLVFLNTCTVREGAAVKVYGKLGDLKRIKEEKDGKMIIGVTGCLAQEVREEFIKKAVSGVKRCIKDGISVIGYMYWSLIDNFEWQKGFSMTFGLIEVDRKTMKRTPKKSLKVLGEVL